nr:MAG TPA: hypothetical protein [Caudoviricetes sp.]
MKNYTEFLWRLAHVKKIKIFRRYPLGPSFDNISIR